MLETISAAIAVTQGIVGTCKAIDIAITAVKTSEKTLDRWNTTSALLCEIAEQFEYVLRKRNDLGPNGAPLGRSNFGNTVRNQLNSFHMELQDLQKNLSKPTLVDNGKSDLRLMRKFKLAFAMDWKENEEIFQWIDRQISTLSMSLELIKT
jgi:hypothetical protein